MGGYEAHQKRREDGQMSSMWDRFGYVGAMCFTGYKDRLPALKHELARVGLLDKVTFHWDFPNDVFRERAARGLPFKNENRKRCFPLGYSNYRVVKTAYHLGSDRCLVIQDDIRFLKDVGEIERILSMLPEDYELAMLDKNLEGGAADLERWMRDPRAMKVNDAWISFNSMYSAGCYAMSRGMMERYIMVYERGQHQAAGEGMLSCDEYFTRRHLGKDARLYAAVPSVAVQAVKGVHCIDGYWRNLERSGTHRENYSE